MLKEARRIRKNFNAKLDRLTHKARSGNNQAAIDVIRVMTEYEEKLREINYTTNDNGKLIPIDDEWRAKQNDKKSKINQLTLLARSGDGQAIFDLVKLLGQEDD